MQNSIWALWLIFSSPSYDLLKVTSLVQVSKIREERLEELDVGRNVFNSHRLSAKSIILTNLIVKVYFWAPNSDLSFHTFSYIFVNFN